MLLKLTICLDSYIYIYILVFTSLTSCSVSTESESYQHKRDNIINVSDKIKKIDTGDAIIGRIARLHIIDKFLFIVDGLSSDNLIHIYDKKDFRYINSIVWVGQGPGEIVRIGHIAEDRVRHKFYVSDYGKMRIFSYDIDSALSIPNYMPTVKIKMDETNIPVIYDILNDTIAIGTNKFWMFAGSWNMSTGETTRIDQINSNVKRKRVHIATSIEHNMFVEFDYYYDLMEIYTLDGKLKKSVFGPNWKQSKRGRENIHYHGNAVFCGDEIFVIYNDDPDSYYSSKLVGFDIEGNYTRTLEAGEVINYFCYEKENNRIIMFLENDMQFGFLNLDEIDKRQ